MWVEDADFWAVSRMTGRSVAFFEGTDSKISEWLEDRPSIRTPSELGAGWIPDLLTARIANHITVRPDISTPWEQQINFETTTQPLGLTDLTMIEAAIALTNRVKRNHFLPSPNYIDPYRQSDIDITDAIRLARIFHRVGIGTLEGWAVPFPQFILRLGLTFGARIEGFDSQSPGDRIIRICNRKHLLASEIISDYRRHVEHWDSLAAFSAMVAIRFRCLGFSYGCSMREMILTAADIYRLSRRIQRLSTFSTHLPIHQADLVPETDSSPSWLDYADSDEQN